MHTTGQPGAEDDSYPIGCGYGFLWIGASVVGFLPVYLPQEFATLGFYIVGALAQWFVLRKHVRHAEYWLLATAAWPAAGGLLVRMAEQLDILVAVYAGQFGVTYITFIAPFVHALLIGLALGLFQWLVMRDLVGWPRWWVWLTAAGWTLGRGAVIAVQLLGLPTNILDILVPLLLGGTFGAVTGLGLVYWLARQSLPIDAGRDALEGGRLGGVVLGVWVPFALAGIAGLPSGGDLGSHLLRGLTDLFGLVVGAPFLIVGFQAITSLAQWLVLRRVLPRVRWWIPASIIAGLVPRALITAGGLVYASASGLDPMDVFEAVASFLDPFLDDPAGLNGWALAAVPVAIAQWLVLRRNVRRAGWWLAIAIVAWGVSVPIGNLSLAILHGVGIPTSVGSILFGLVTGWGITLLLRPHLADQHSSQSATVPAPAS